MGSFLLKTIPENYLSICSILLLCQAHTISGLLTKKILEVRITERSIRTERNLEMIKMRGVIFLSLILSFSLLASVRGQAASQEENIEQVKKSFKELLDEGEPPAEKRKTGLVINFFIDRIAEFIVKVCFNNCACFFTQPPTNLSDTTLPENTSQIVKGVSNLLSVDACISLLELFDICMDTCTEICL